MHENASRRGVIAIVAALVGAVAFAACSPPQPDASACSSVETATLEAISARLTVDGTLRNGRMFAKTSPRRFFVSAELLPAGEGDDFDGDILTWAAAAPAAEEFVAVDANAREHSGWPAAGFDVRDDGAIESRGCVLLVRGAPEGGGCEATQPGLEQLC